MSSPSRPTDPFARTEHRPWPLPERPWIMSQSWHDLLFAHWPLPADALRPLIPPRLRIDTYDGTAWIGVVPFVMRRTRPFRIPLPFGLGDLPELNVRTYVVAGDKPGVWFFSLDAGSAPAVWAARRWYHLPYYNARMTVRAEREGIYFSSHRRHGGAPPAAFEARYGPTTAPYSAEPGSLEHWLTERYCLYASDRRGNLYRGENQHAPWPLQAAEAEITTHTMCRAHGISLPEDKPPLLHFARRLDVVFWGLEKLQEA